MVSFSFACALADLGSDMQVPETNRCVILSGPTASKSARTEGAEAWFSSGCDRTDLSDRYEAGGGHVFPGQGAKSQFPAAVICTLCRSTKHRPNGPFRSDMAATLARLGANFGQQAPTSAQLGPIGHNFGRAWLQDGTTWPQLTWTHLEVTSAQVKVHMGSKWGT